MKGFFLSNECCSFPASLKLIYELNSMQGMRYAVMSFEQTTHPDVCDDRRNS